MALCPIDPADQALLDRFFALQGDLAALAQETGRSLLDLNLWADSPEIAPIIELHRINAAAARREKALAALESVLKTSCDPIEVRRTACALLRWLRVPRHVPSELDLPLPARADTPLADPRAWDERPAEPSTAQPPRPAFSPIQSIINLFREPRPATAAPISDTAPRPQPTAPPPESPPIRPSIRFEPGSPPRRPASLLAAAAGRRPDLAHPDNGRLETGHLETG